MRHLFLLALKKFSNVRISNRERSETYEKYKLGTKFKKILNTAKNCLPFIKSFVIVLKHLGA